MASIEIYSCMKLIKVGIKKGFLNGFMTKSGQTDMSTLKCWPNKYLEIYSWQTCVGGLYDRGQNYVGTGGQYDSMTG